MVPPSNRPHFAAKTVWTSSQNPTAVRQWVTSHAPHQLVLLYMNPQAHGFLSMKALAVVKETSSSVLSTSSTDVHEHRVLACKASSGSQEICLAWLSLACSIVAGCARGIQEHPQAAVDVTLVSTGQSGDIKVGVPGALPFAAELRRCGGQ